MDYYIIQVQPTDELTSVIDKIISTQAERVYLLVPANSRIAQLALNFRLIKREAESLGKEIIIVSSSAQVQNLALKSSLQAHLETDEFTQLLREANDARIPPMQKKLDDVVIPRQYAPASGVQVKPNQQSEVEQSSQAPEQKIPAGNSPKILETSHVLSEKIDVLFNKSKALAKIAPPVFSRFHLIKDPRLALCIMICLAAIFAATTFYSVLPRAKIHIKPLAEDITLELIVTGDLHLTKAIPDNFKIPAQLFEKSFQATRVVKSTGEKELRQKSRGVIKIYNTYSSSPQTLVASTRFISEGGKIFRTVATVIVPGAEVEGGTIVPSFIAADVIADEPGEAYNIGSSTFSIPGFKGTAKYLSFYGKSEGSMSGGKIGKVKVITEKDYNDAVFELKSELRAETEREMSLLLPQGLFIPDGARSAREVKITSVDQIGNAVAEFTIAGSTAVEAFAIRLSEITDLVDHDFEERFPGKKIIATSKNIVYKTEVTDFDKGIVKVKAALSSAVYLSIDPAEIVHNVAGKDELGVREFLATHRGIRETNITFWPFWVKKMPLEADKINVIISTIEPVGN